MDQIVSFCFKYNFDKSRIILHRNMLLDRYNGIRVIEIPEPNQCYFLCSVPLTVYLKNVIPELFRLLKIILTLPVPNTT